MKLEFSKKLAIGVMIIYAVFVFIGFYLKAYKDINVEGILGIVTPIPMMVVGFYYNKAKSENMVKIQNQNESGGAG